MPYDPVPHYPLVDGRIASGYTTLAAHAAASTGGVIALDGPATLPWDRLVGALQSALAAAGVLSGAVDFRRCFMPWPRVRLRTDQSSLTGDEEFARVHEGSLADLVARLPDRELTRQADVTLLFGPGSAIAPHDHLWHLDAPKRVGLAAVREGTAGNIAQPPGSTGCERRLKFIDWPMFDRHKQRFAASWDVYVDVTVPDHPRWVTGDALRRTLRHLSMRPFRTRPTFSPGAWGGQWLRTRLGVPGEGPNVAWSYELIAPESGVLLGEVSQDRDEAIEVGFEVLMAVAGPELIGMEATERFGRSFPIRFDYLDTMGGSDLSVHCHPRERAMREVFGWSYPQHESYYVMASQPRSRIMLGLKPQADLASFRAEAELAEREARPCDITRYVATFPARRHGLYLIPAGTPHASGAGNVVLEISTTPYLYSLRFYDWLRGDLDGSRRRVHLGSAFANLDSSRRGEAVAASLVPEPVALRDGSGFRELGIGRLPELFFAVHRLDFDVEATDDTDGRFHVLNLVEGEEIAIATSAASHPLSYAETILVPASVGSYRLRNLGAGTCKVVKAFVP